MWPKGCLTHSSAVGGRTHAIIQAQTHTHTHLPPSAHTHTLDPSLGASGLPYAERGQELKTLINIISIIIEI